MAHLSEPPGASGYPDGGVAGMDAHAERLQLQLLTLGKMPDIGLFGAGGKTPYNFPGEDF